MSGNVTMYGKRRKKSGLSKVDMARELGVDYKRYNLIERGDVIMPTKLIDKFNEIVNRGKENTLMSLQNGSDAKEYWDAMCKKDENGKYVLYTKMEEFNINGVKELATLLGYKSPGMIYEYLKHGCEINNDFMKRVYLFFTNELNIQDPATKINARKARKKPAHDKELDKYYKETNFKRIINDNGLKCKDIASELHMDAGSFSKMINKVRKPNDKQLFLVKEYFDKLSTKDEDSVSLVGVSLVDDGNYSLMNASVYADYNTNYTTREEHTITKELLSKYEEEMKTIDDNIKHCEECIKKYVMRKDICLEIIGVIKEIENPNVVGVIKEIENLK